MSLQYMTTTAVAKDIGVKPWMVRRLYESGKLPEPPTRAGQYRLIEVGDLPQVRKALTDAGYLKPEVAAK